MSKSKKGIIYYLFEFSKLVLTVVKCLLLLLWNAAKWVASIAWAVIKFLLDYAKKSDEKRKELELDASRPISRANYAEFEEIEPLKGTLAAFESRIYSSKSLIGLILGARGSGKSAVGMRLLENVAAKSNKRVYCMGFGKENLPKWIKSISNLEEVANDSFILIDEGGIEFSSRDSMSDSNKLLSQVLLISRHKNLSVLFISQNSSNIEINTLRQSDYLLLKSPSLLQLDFERKKIKEIYQEVDEKFKKYKKEIGLMYVYSDSYRGFAKNSLPSFWKEELSKSYADKLK